MVFYSSLAAASIQVLTQFSLPPKRMSFRLVRLNFLAVSTVHSISHADDTSLGHVVHVNAPEVFFRNLEAAEFVLAAVVPFSVCPFYPAEQLFDGCTHCTFTPGICILICNCLCKVTSYLDDLQMLIVFQQGPLAHSSRSFFLS